MENSVSKAEFSWPIASTKVLIVEDFEPYRALIVSLLKDVAAIEVVCQVGNGVSAIEAAEKLKTPLIFMDIGLPDLNGIEAARRIRRFLPDCKILFISQESSPDIIQEALALGNCSYVAKSKAATDLVPAVIALLQDRKADRERYQSTEIRGKLRGTGNQ